MGLDPSCTLHVRKLECRSVHVALFLQAPARVQQVADGET